MYSSALIVGGFCHGMIYVSGMAYVHVRAGMFRVQRIAFLHIVYLFGVAATSHYIHEHARWNEAENELEEGDNRWTDANKPIAHLFFGFSGIAIVVMLLHFLLQGRCYDATRFGDDEMQLANAKGDNFKSTLGMPVMRGLAEKPGYMAQFKVAKLWLSGKLTGGLIFNNLLIGVVFFSQKQLFPEDHNQYGFLIHYLVIIGLFLGYGASFFVPLKFMFVPVTFLHCVLLIIAMALYTGGHYIFALLFMWLWYIIVGTVYFVPDVALMETSHVQVYETILGIGYCFEAVPLMIATFMTNQYLIPISTDSMWIAGSISIAGLVLASIGMIFWNPITLRRSLLDIQYMLLYPGQLENIRKPDTENLTVTWGSAPQGSVPKDIVLNPIVTPQVPVVNGGHEVPYPEVKPTQPSVQGIQAAVVPNGTTTHYPSPPGADSNEIYTDKSQEINNM